MLVIIIDRGHVLQDPFRSWMDGTTTISPPTQVD